MNSIIKNALCIIAFLLISNQVSANPCVSHTNINSGFQLVSTSITLGSGLGESGLHTFDSNQNGLTEFIFGTGHGFGGNTRFVIAEYNSSSGQFDLLCQSAHYEDGISVISPFSNNVIATGSLVGGGKGDIEVFDHAAGSIVRLIQTSFRGIEDIKVGDVDNDGEPEIAVLSENAINIYDANTYVFERSLNYGGNEFALGHFTTTSKIQMAINGGYVLELNGDALSTVWDYTVIGFSDFHLEAGDIDKDGLDEIVAADSWYNMRVFNADNKGILWEHNADLDIDSVAVYDVTGDGVPEVLYGDGQHGNVYALNGNNGTQLWSVENPQSGVTDVFAGDVDGDASLELVWGAGNNSSGPDYLFIHDIDSDTRQWQSPEGAEGGITGVSFGHLNTDSVLDRIVASFESQAGDGILTAYDGATDNILWQTTPRTFERAAWGGLNDVTVADIDSDGTNEVLVATSRTYDGRVFVLDAASGEISGTVALDDSSAIYSVRVTNFDEDTAMELLVGGEAHIYVIDGSTLTLERTLPRLNNSGRLRVIEIVDIDQDNTQEVIGLLSSAYIIDPDNNGLLATAADEMTSLAVISDTLSGAPVVYVGDTDGTLFRLKADASLAPVNRLCYGELAALEAISSEKLVFVCDGVLGIYHVTSGSVTWITQYGFDKQLGQYDRLKVTRIGGNIQILVGGSSAYLFEASEASITDNSLSFQVRGLLQGAYTYDLEPEPMHSNLVENRALPEAQPYADLLDHTGNETLSPLIMDIDGDNAPVDWVLLELRDANNPAIRIFSYATILQRDGDVADSLGNLTTLTIPNVAAGDYYVSLRHRNHLGVMTAEPVTLSATPTLIDFSDPSTEVFGSHARRQVGSVSLLWSGDVNQDNKIIGAGPGNDNNNVLSAVLVSPDNEGANTNFAVPGYAVSDLNMDGMIIHSGPNNDVNLIMANVLLHPGNTQNAGNFVVQGSLP